jgi:hypothetical protein
MSLEGTHYQTVLPMLYPRGESYTIIIYPDTKNFLRWHSFSSLFLVNKWHVHLSLTDIQTLLLAQHNSDLNR